MFDSCFYERSYALFLFHLFKITTERAGPGIAEQQTPSGNIYLINRASLVTFDIGQPLAGKWRSDMTNSSEFHFNFAIRYCQQPIQICIIITGISTMQKRDVCCYGML